MNKQIVDEIINKLSTKFTKNDRMIRCINQIVEAWTEEDGTSEELKNFCFTYYVEDEEKINSLLKKAEHNFDVIDGYMLEMYRNILEPVHLDTGKLEQSDSLFAEFNPMTHLTEDFFASKIAFLILLNFPVYTLEEKDSLGAKWSNFEWTKARLADRFSERIPPKVLMASSLPMSKAGVYISDYNICMDHIIVDGKVGIFPKGMKLISHWGLRDELKGLYREPNSIRKREIIEQILKRIVHGEIPECVINNEEYDWDPVNNEVFKNGEKVDFKQEGSRRYEYLRQIFLADKNLDSFVPKCPNAIDRNFEFSVEISEDRVRKMLISILESDVIKDIAKIVEKKLGRPLRAFDIWYPGFKDASNLNDDELNKIIEEKYGNREGFQQKIPEILRAFGFANYKADYLASKITVDPSRGAGHAMGAGGKHFNSHLRTRFDSKKMNYISYNVAIHELGHCVEQVFSLNNAPSTLMSGVPNTAFTEGFAFVFQGRDQEVLGVGGSKEKSDAMHRIHGFWHCFELCGVSLVCVDTWHFMYDHPDATAEEIKDFVVKISKEYWNKWFAPIFNEKDSILLGVYSHMIEYGLYLPNYPLGEIIRSQIESYLENKSLAEEMERLCSQGKLTPDIWLLRGTGNNISTDFIIKYAKQAVEKFETLCE